MVELTIRTAPSATTRLRPPSSPVGTGFPSSPSLVIRARSVHHTDAKRELCLGSDPLWTMRVILRPLSHHHDTRNRSRWRHHCQQKSPWRRDLRPRNARRGDARARPPCRAKVARARHALAGRRVRAPASSAACSAWRPISAGSSCARVAVDRVAERSDGRARRGARGSDACAPSRVPPRRASRARSARARERASRPARPARVRVDIFLRSIAWRPIGASIDERVAPQRRRARRRDSASRPCAPRTGARDARARPSCARSPSRPTCRDRAGARCPGRAASCAGQRPPAVQQRVHERPLPAPRRRMHDHARRLVDDDQRRVLVQHGERQRLRLGDRRRDGRHLDLRPGRRRARAGPPSRPGRRSSRGRRRSGDATCERDEPRARRRRRSYRDGRPRGLGGHDQTWRASPARHGAREERPRLARRRGGSAPPARRPTGTRPRRAGARRTRPSAARRRGRSSKSKRCASSVRGASRRTSDCVPMLATPSSHAIAALHRGTA